VTTAVRVPRGELRAPRWDWFRPDIEGLRAVAILLVVLDHAHVPGMSGGYVGVDVFFVISGFLITSLLLRELEATGSISIRGFYARRFMRLIPAAALVTITTLVAAWLWLPRVRFRSITMDALTASVYGINYRLAGEGVDYLRAADAPSPLQHYWSLAVEEQFYAVWPVLLLTASLALLGARVIRRGRVAAVMAGVVAVSFALSVHQTGAAVSWAYFGLPTRAWELAVGALVAVSARRCRRMPRAPARIIGPLGIAAVVASAVVLDSGTPFPGYAAALPVLGAAAVIAAGFTHPVGLLHRGPLQQIGTVSYSWYLWHWPVLIITPFAVGLAPNLWVNLGLACLSLAAAALTYVFVENPARTARRLVRRPVRAVAVGLVLSSSVAAVSGAGLVVPLRGLTVGGDAPTIALAPRSADERQLAQTIDASLDTRAVPANLTPTLDVARDDTPAINRDRCNTGTLDNDVKRTCVYGDAQAPRTMVLMGDSHAGHWFPALDVIARQWHLRLITVVKDSCSAADALTTNPVLKRPFVECAQWRRQAWRYIASLRPAVVVMASNGDGGRILGKVGDQDRAWAAAWERSVRKVEVSGAQVVVLEDTPWPHVIVPDCVAAKSSDVRLCARSRSTAVLQRARRALAAAAIASTGAVLVDPTSWFCGRDTCPVIIGNVLVYRDASHITATYARAIEPVLAESLQPVLGGSLDDRRAQD